MKNKILSTLIIVSIFTVVPLIIKLNLMSKIEWIIITTSLIILFFTQPPLNFNEVKTKSIIDKHSILLILLMCGTSAITPIVEWAYNRNGESTENIFLLIGLILILSGLIIRITAIKILGNHFTATVQITHKHQLIIKGPYKFIRHPSYLGAFLVFMGISFLLESWLGLIISIISMMTAYYIRINIEEKALINYFGDDYIKYQKKTKKMFPYIW